MSPSLKILSGATQRIAAEALAKDSLSHEELTAAVVLYKTQRDDARAEVERLRALLAEKP